MLSYIYRLIWRNLFFEEGRENENYIYHLSYPRGNVNTYRNK